MHMSMHSNHSQDHTWSGLGLVKQIQMEKWSYWKAAQRTDATRSYTQMIALLATNICVAGMVSKAQQKSVWTIQRDGRSRSQTNQKTIDHLVRFMKKINKIGEVGAVEKDVTTDVAKNLNDNFRHWERTWNFLLTAMVDIVEKQAEKTRKETQPKSVRKLSNISLEAPKVEATCCTQIVEPTPWRASAELPATFERDAACEARVIEQSKYCDKHWKVGEPMQEIDNTPWERAHFKRARWKFANHGS